MDNMTSNRPYLLRAFYDWIVDNECTPYIVVEADMPHVKVPPQTVKDGQVVLNISPSAVHGLDLSAEHVVFSARFSGVPFAVYIPMYAISAIYARENGAGTMFPPEDVSVESESTAEAELSEATTSPDVALVDKAPVDKAPVDKAETDEAAAGEKELDTVQAEDKPKPKKGSHLSLVK